MSSILPIFVGALLVSAVTHAAAIKVFPNLGLLDKPDRYGLNRNPIPYPTGLICILLFLVAFICIQPILNESFSMQHIGLAAAILILGISSFIDDKVQIPPLIRIGVQIACALIIFGTGTRIFTLTNPLSSFTGIADLQLDTWTIVWPALSNPSVIGAIFTVVWIGLTINALNWFDGITGQVSTISIIGFVTIGFLSLSSRVDQPELALICFLLAGIAIGSLIFEIPPAKILMGDTGAMFFGFMLGVVTIYAGGKVATAFLVLGIPILDFIIVIGRRVLKRKPVLKGNQINEHLHHRLLTKGWSPRSIIILTAIIGTLFGTSAL
ncbi:undecaprenyl/decaprenyl-phosphate alpha-N-acetylglucosaminyl 1-phosphate transferase, partial [Candidatus Peregrinibacteria bacterium]|nr:undecaprenyl/decaprenyl-phosphate alpha-N-acetylglucosaminyl 1-phosphate transferase [Candidatus Peregrinibacteria bacterium]